MGSQIVNWRQIAVCSVITLGLAGCANDNNQAAPISSVGDNGAGSRSGSTTTYSPPPRISSVGSVSNNTQPVPSAVISHPSSDAAVTTREGKIVYNRSYNSIPKGSYSGNTYTVKRGDTLFYIAWITGNDYRELAQRNNIQEPYSLNVGQSLSRRQHPGHGDCQRADHDNDIRAGNNVRAGRKQPGRQRTYAA
jgi:lipoprotein NlpD